jgi:hypothetical protein
MLDIRFERFQSASINSLEVLPFILHLKGLKWGSGGLTERIADGLIDGLTERSVEGLLGYWRRNRPKGWTGISRGINRNGQPRTKSIASAMAWSESLGSRKKSEFQKFVLRRCLDQFLCRDEIWDSSA